MRAWRLRAACRDAARARATWTSAEAALRSRANAVVATVAVARTLRPARLRVEELPQAVEGCTPLVESLEEAYPLDRASLGRTATAQATDETALEYPYARAVVRTPHFPLLLGRLPLSAVDELHAVPVDGGARTLYIRRTAAPSAAHEALLTAEFREKWMHHVRMVAGVRNVGVYDVFEDAAETRFVGGLVVERFLAKTRGRLYPALSIESIAVVSKERGDGTRLVDVARRLLFFRTPPLASSGFLFAQCLDSDFWAGERGGLLDHSATALCLVFQMQTLFASYHFEEDCTCRARLVHVDDEGTSPRKQAL